MHKDKNFKESVLIIIKDAAVLVIGVLSFALVVLIFVSLFFLIAGKAAKADGLLEEYLSGGSYKTSLEANQRFLLPNKYIRLSKESKKGDGVPMVRYKFFSSRLGRYISCVPITIKHSDGTIVRKLMLQ